MNIQRLKKSTNVLFLFAGILLSTSCDAQNKKKVVEILTGIEIKSNDYHYSDEFHFKLDSVEYSLRSRAIYDTNGDIQQLEIYKPEGKSNYDRLKLLEDKRLMEYYGFPFHQNFIYSDGVIIKNKDDRINVAFTGDYLINKDDNMVRFYKIK